MFCRNEVQMILRVQERSWTLRMLKRTLKYLLIFELHPSFGFFRLFNNPINIIIWHVPSQSHSCSVPGIIILIPSFSHWADLYLFRLLRDYLDLDFSINLIRFDFFSFIREETIIDSFFLPDCLDLNLISFKDILSLLSFPHSSSFAFMTLKVTFFALLMLWNLGNLSFIWRFYNLLDCWI